MKCIQDGKRSQIKSKQENFVKCMVIHVEYFVKVCQTLIDTFDGSLYQEKLDLHIHPTTITHHFELFYNRYTPLYILRSLHISKVRST